jgi:hypothetical protein
MTRRALLKLPAALAAAPCVALSTRRWQYRALGCDASEWTTEEAYASLERSLQWTLEALGNPPVREISRFFRESQNAYGMSMKVLVDPITAKI